MNLREVLKEYKGAIGHFNVSDYSQLKAVAQASKELNKPVIIGVSEGERNFWGTKKIANLVKTIREEEGVEIFLNADHTHSFEKIKEAVEAGFDAVLFDASKGNNLDDNIQKTKEVVEFVKEYNKNNGTDVLVEAEIGYLGSGSEILNEIPEGADITEKDITTAEEAKKFVEETGIDLLAPAVGNIHGMFKDAPNPHLFIDRIKEIDDVVDANIVLHGGSGIREEEFLSAVKAGVSIVHISTEIRLMWKEGVENSIKENLNEVAPYKILSPVIEDIKKIVKEKINLFGLEG